MNSAVLKGQLERAVTGDADARQRLLELTRDRLMHHAAAWAAIAARLHPDVARLDQDVNMDM